MLSESTQNAVLYYEDCQATSSGWGLAPSNRGSNSAGGRSPLRLSRFSWYESTVQKGSPRNLLLYLSKKQERFNPWDQYPLSNIYTEAQIYFPVESVNLHKYENEFESNLIWVKIAFHSTSEVFIIPQPLLLLASQISLYYIFFHRYW